MLHLLAVAIPSNLVLDWALAHIHWPFICYAGWKVSRWVTELQARALLVEGHVVKMATNCIPTIQVSLGKQDTYLDNIDKNIQRMADKL